MKVLLVHNYYAYAGGEDSVFRNELTLLQNNGIEIHKMEFDNKNGLLRNFINFLLSPFNFLSYRRVTRFLNENDIDLVHIHNWHFAASPAIICAAKSKGIPVIHTLHNYRLLCPSAILFHKGEVYRKGLNTGFPWKAIKDRVYRNSLIQTFMVAFTVKLHKLLGTWKKVDCFITLSPFAKDLLLQNYTDVNNSSVAVKPNFTQDKGYSEGHQFRSGFLFVGRLSAEKGIDVLLEAADKAGIELTIAGDGPLSNLVQAFAAKNQRIKYVGRKSNDEIIELLKRANALIFPSIWYEGMPMIIIESFSTGTPVIASKFGVMEHMVEHAHNGLQFEVGCANDLQKNLTRFENFTMAEKNIISVNARHTYDKFYTPESNLKQILSLYRQVLGQHFFMPLESNSVLNH